MMTFVRSLVLPFLVGLGACSSSDPASIDCSVTLSGDVTGTESCRVFLCYPTGGDYQSLDIARALDAKLDYALIAELTAPRTFTPTSYSLTDFRPESQFAVTGNGKRYVARARPTHTADEQVALNLSEVKGYTGEDVCSGTVRGTLSASLVEISNEFQPNEMVGPGRVTATVTIR